MATAVVTARPAQALRQRRESQRPTRSLTKGTPVENGDPPPPPKEAPPKPYGEETRVPIVARFVLMS